MDRQYEASATIIELRERLAESRHNEKLGWGAVLTSAVLVMTLSLLTRLVPMGMDQGQGAGTTVVSLGPGSAVLFDGLDVVAGLYMLSSILVVLGVCVAVYCRFIRSKAYAELKAALEPLALEEGIE